MTKKSYHLNLQKSQIKHAKIALLPGDPFRVAKIPGVYEGMAKASCIEFGFFFDYNFHKYAKAETVKHCVFSFKHSQSIDS